MNEPRWLSRVQAEAIHEDQVREHGGLAGVRDENALESALARPINLFLHEKADLFALAAAYAHGIAKNHPFHDGNKRAAFVAADVFLKKNGHTFSMSEQEAVTVMVGLASSEISQEQFAEFIRTHSKAFTPDRSWLTRRRKR